jgi:hypothetical protein
MDATTIPEEDRAKRTLRSRTQDTCALTLGQVRTGLQANQ